mmetsp:Transcript_92985/g.170571  ORF Transcript_92985/g.170571 Transcript_92985/m.170571 type:complete len:207 (+) Transcript_92985:298-918(+)
MIWQLQQRGWPLHRHQRPVLQHLWWHRPSAVGERGCLCCFCVYGHSIQTLCRRPWEPQPRTALSGSALPFLCSVSPAAPAAPRSACFLQVRPPSQLCASPRRAASLPDSWLPPPSLHEPGPFLSLRPRVASVSLGRPCPFPTPRPIVAFVTRLAAARPQHLPWKRPPSSGVQPRSSRLHAARAQSEDHGWRDPGPCARESAPHIYA